MSHHSSVIDPIDMDNMDMERDDENRSGIGANAQITDRQRRHMERDRRRAEQERKRVELLMLQEEEEKRARELQKAIQAREKEIESLADISDSIADMSREDVESTEVAAAEGDIDETVEDKRGWRSETNRQEQREQDEKDHETRDKDGDLHQDHEDLGTSFNIEQGGLQLVNGPEVAKRKLQVIEREKKRISVAAQTALEELDKEAWKAVKEVEGLSLEGEEEKRALVAQVRQEEDEKARMIAKEMKWKEEEKKLLEEEKQRYRDAVKRLEEEKERVAEQERKRRIEADSERISKFVQEQKELLRANLKEYDAQKRKRILPVPKTVKAKCSTINSLVDLGQPIDNSTDVDEEKEKETEFRREMSWLDERFRQVVHENRTVPEPKPARVVAKKVAIKKVKEEHLGDNENDSLRLPVQPEEKSVTQEPDMKSDEEERRLKEKVERLKKKEEDLAVRIKKAKRKKEEDERRIREQTLREERIRKLKEQEQSLIESLQERETELSELESSKNETKESLTQKKKKEEIKAPVLKDERGKKHHKEIETTKEKEARKTPSVSFKKPTIPKLTEDTFEEWKIEVEVILKAGLYHEDIVRQEVRNSLSGNTRKVLLNMDPDASTKELITKLENIYGNIRTGEAVLAEFYNAQQKDNETSAEWGVRVESILNTAIKKGQVQRGQADEMLRNRFWRHLRSFQLKNATRVFYETEKDFLALRRKVRIEENELKTAKDNEKRDKQAEKYAISQQRTESSEQVSLMKNILERMDSLEKEISRKSDPTEKKQEDTSRHGQGDSEGYRYYDNPRGGYNNRNRNWNRGGYRRGNGNRRYNRGSYNSHSERNTQNDERENSSRENRQDDGKKEDTKDQKQEN